MFSRPIVFVVGAAASKEFRLPTGAEMNAQIADASVLNLSPSISNMLEAL